MNKAANSLLGIAADCTAMRPVACGNEIALLGALSVEKLRVTCAPECGMQAVIRQMANAENKRIAWQLFQKWKVGPSVRINDKTCGHSRSESIAASVPTPAATR
jgi:hypothetical protein